MDDIHGQNDLNGAHDGGMHASSAAVNGGSDAAVVETRPRSVSLMEADAPQAAGGGEEAREATEGLEPRPGRSFSLADEALTILEGIDLAAAPDSAVRGRGGAAGEGDMGGGSGVQGDSVADDEREEPRFKRGMRTASGGKKDGKKDSKGGAQGVEEARI